MSQRASGATGAAELQLGVPVEMVPTTARQHITEFAALNIPHAWRLSRRTRTHWSGYGRIRSKL